MSEQSAEQPGKGIARRTVVKGAAWSVPVIAAAAAVPAQAASGGTSGNIQVLTLPFFIAPNVYIPDTQVRLLNKDGSLAPAGVPVTFVILAGDANYKLNNTGAPSKTYIESSLYGGWTWSRWLWAGSKTGPVIIQASAPGYGSVTFTDTVWQGANGNNYNVVGQWNTLFWNFQPRNFRYQLFPIPATNPLYQGSIQIELTGGGPVMFSDGSFKKSFPVTSTATGYTQVDLPDSALVKNPNWVWPDYANQLVGVTAYSPSNETFTIWLTVERFRW